MKIKSAVYVTSITRPEDFPSGDRPEVAFIGRSNVGKSSLINLLLGNRKLARTSATPGKTQTINYYLINNSWYMVDLPGYGWARVSKKKKMAWSKFVREYLLKRQNLNCLFILLDVRHEPQPIDLQFLDWCVEIQIPIALVFTKADKLSGNKIINSIEKYKKILLKSWAYLPQIFITSIVDQRGKEEIIGYLESISQD
jgi:GTP-binding protein